MTYNEFKNLYKEPKYFGLKCFVCGCNEPAEYEGGDSRWSCGVCEKHSSVPEMWESRQNKINIKNNSIKPHMKINYEQFKF